MIGRADIEGSKSNVAMCAWLPQVSSWRPPSTPISGGFRGLRVRPRGPSAHPLPRGSSSYLKRLAPPTPYRALGSSTNLLLVVKKGDVLSCPL